MTKISTLENVLTKCQSSQNKFRNLTTIPESQSVEYDHPVFNGAIGGKVENHQELTT